MKINLELRIYSVLSFKVAKLSKLIITLPKLRNGVIAYDLNGNIVWNYDDKVFNYFIKDSYFIMISNYDSFQYNVDISLGKKNENNKLLSGVFDDEMINNKTLFIDRDALRVGIIDLETKHEIWASSYESGNYKLLSIKILIWWKSSKIKLIDYKTGNFLFESSVSELGKYTWSDGVKTHREEGKVERIIGIFGEVLVCVITGGGEWLRGNTQLIGLDTNTGNLLWQIEQFIGTPNRQLPATATLMPDAQNKYLVGFQSGDFIEIDPQVGKVLRYSQINLVYEQHTLTGLMDSFSLQGDHLYFRSSVSSMGGFPTAIGAFNYKTETIEWLHVFEEFAKEGKFIPINQPKAEGNRVYALDSGSTLHIFEREE